MADDAATAADDTPLTFNVKAANDKKHVITIAAGSTVAELKAKLATPDFADIPADRQRLIYSGRVLKDPDTLASAKIRDGHTVHLVKGAASNARQNPAAQGASSSAGAGGSPPPQVPTNIAAGTGNNPLAGLTGARYAGFHGLPGADMFGPDGGMGPPPDSEQLLQMMDNPMFLSQMNEAMNNPQVIEMMTQSPMVRNNPMLADMLRNPEMRRMLFNPEMMRMQLQMQRSMGGGGPRFPAPGVTDTTPQPNSTATPNQPNTAGSNQQPDPFAGLLGGAGGAGAGTNPFAALFGPPGANPFSPPQQAQPGSESAPNADGTRDQSNTSPPPNPFASLFGAPPAGSGGQTNPLMEMTQNIMQNPEAMQQFMQMMNAMNGGSGGLAPFGTPQNTNSSGTPTSNSPAPNPFGNLFGAGGFGGFGTPPPADNRPPEEVYETQLRQLNEMGFYDFDRNVQALRRSGGNVQAAIDWLFTNTS